MINKTFSKGDCIDIIRTFNIDIPNFTSMNKSTLSVQLWNVLCNTQNIPVDNDIYDIKDIEELKIYLKTLSVRDKNKLMRFCKEIIIYCNNGYYLNSSIFNDIEELKLQIEDICKYGDIPSVRRAIKLFNNDPKVDKKYIPVLSNRVRKNLELKDKRKIKKYYGISFNKGNYILTFT